jgi:hypothetical protein
MTRRELGSLAIRLFALYLLVSAFQIAASGLFSVLYLRLILPLTQNYYRSSPTGSYNLFSALFSMIPALINAAAGVYLIRKSHALGAGLLPGGDPEAPIATISLYDAQTVAFSVVGLYLLAASIARFCAVYPTLSYMPRNTYVTGPRPGFVNVTEAVAQFVLGLFLFFGSRLLARLWWSLNPRAAYPAAAEPDEPRPVAAAPAKQD